MIYLTTVQLITMSSTAQPITGSMLADAGESVVLTLQVTRPDASLASPQSITLDTTTVSGTGSVPSGTSFTDSEADQTGTYSALFTSPATSKYQAVSVTKTFTISSSALIDRAPTLSIGNSV